MTTTTTPRRLLAAAAGELTVDAGARTIGGLCVPFGIAGLTSSGRLLFTAGALRWSDPARVALLREHDQRDPLGHAIELRETTAGLFGVFLVGAGENGDRALAEAAAGVRSGLSIGAELDDDTIDALIEGDGRTPVRATGQLREVSHVSVPAFDDARLAASAGALVLGSWSGASPIPTTGRFPMPAMTASNPAPEQQPPAPGTSPEQPTPQPAPAPAQPTPGPTTPEPGPEQPATAAGPHTVTAGAPGPAVVPAVAGAARVTSEGSTYRFDGTDSLVRDAFMARVDADADAARRVARFNAELRSGNPASVAAFATAAATRDDVDGAGTDLPALWGGQTTIRGNLMRDVVDRNRPLISRLDRVAITNAQPFGIPKVGEFEGVGDHVEGTPHRPAGTLSLSGDVVQPTASSGAWEVSRELVDAANPAIDRVAMRAMLRDYRRHTENKLVTLLAARGAQSGGTVYDVDTPLALRGALLDFVNDDDEPADLLAVSASMLRTLALDTDTTERPQLPYVGASNAQGTFRAGFTGVTIDGVEVARANRLAANTGVLARSEGILWAESNVLQFRFDEVLGPGVIKLALWAYSGAAILDVDDVAILTTGAAPI